MMLTLYTLAVDLLGQLLLHRRHGPSWMNRVHMW